MKTPLWFDSRRRFNRSRERGMTLVEVMVASMLFAMLSAGLCATFLFNIHSAKSLGFRTQAVNTAMSITEQMRGVGYSDLLNYYYKTSGPASFPIKLIDPTATSATPSYYRTLTLPLNVVETTTVQSAWTPTTVQVDAANASAKLPMRFWVTLKQDQSLTAGQVRQVFQLTLIYQWKDPAAPKQKWQSSTIRIAVPNPSGATIS